MQTRELYRGHRRRPSAKWFWRSKMAFFLISGPLVLLMGWMAYRQVGSYISQPRVALVLGGGTERERFAATFAQQNPTIEIWVSSGTNPEYAEELFASAGINPDRIHLDRTAVDTVTNFTTLADRFRAKGIDSVYLITSDFHMRRARVIGEIVFGSRGIFIKPIAVSSQEGMAEESFLKSVRDGMRSILWVVTGYTGSTLNPNLDARREMLDRQ